MRVDVCCVDGLNDAWVDNCTPVATVCAQAMSSAKERGVRPADLHAMHKSHLDLPATRAHRRAQSQTRPRLAGEPSSSTTRTEQYQCHV